MCCMLCLMLSACIKKYGCNGGAALNYDPKATTTDRSCLYPSTGIFYFDAAKKSEWQNAGVTHISLYLSDQPTFKDFDIDVPINLNDLSCEDPAWMSFDTLIYQYNQEVSLKVYDQDDSLMVAKIIELTGDCVAYNID